MTTIKIQYHNNIQDVRIKKLKCYKSSDAFTPNVLEDRLCLC